MGLRLENLNESGVRNLMLEEYELDVKTGTLLQGIVSLKESAKETYTKLLKDAIVSGNDSILADSILKNRCLKDTKSNGGKMPENATTTLAESEFNRFYIRGMCRKSILESRAIEFYRAKEAKHPRHESEALDGKIVENPQKHLEDLRQNKKDTALGVPKPNSGISVRLRK